MKRSEALAPLSREHHRVLGQAKRLREVAPGDEELVAREFRSFWMEEGGAHFGREEEVLLEASREGDGARPLVERLVREHAAVAEHADHVLQRMGEGGACSGCLTRMGGLLEDLVRFEERELFPALENALDAQQLAAVGERLSSGG